MTDLPLIDHEQIERLNEWGGATLQTKMIDLFLTHAKERLDQIRTGIASGDSNAAETGAHTLKSSAGNVGAKQVQHLAQEAEAFAEEGKLAELKAMLPSLEEAFDSACAALSDVREGVEE
jgi:HPt (histidine-containing phosphotransfer) domain-containing protein